MSIRVTDLRAGTLFKGSDGPIYQVLKYEHIKKGRGGAIVKLKVKSLKLKVTKEISLKSGSKVEEVEAFKKALEFVYLDERRGVLILSDPETKKRLEIPQEVDGTSLKFLKAGNEITGLYLPETSEVVSLELPATVILKVAQTTSSEKGDTAGSARKPATLETGATLQVPMFIQEGDLVKVNTESGEYMERVS